LYHCEQATYLGFCDESCKEWKNKQVVIKHSQTGQHHWQNKEKKKKKQY